MDHHVDPVQGAEQPPAVANVAEKIAEPAMDAGGEPLSHFRLFELVAAEDDKPFRGIVLEERFHQLLAEGPRPARHQHRLTLEHSDILSASASRPRYMVFRSIGRVKPKLAG